MQTITLKAVQAAARDYYNRGLLLAQAMPRPSKSQYADSIYRCAVGAAFNNETLAELAKRGLKDGAFTEGVVYCAPSYLASIRNIQRVHDEWLATGDDKPFKKLLKIA